MTIYYYLLNEIIKIQKLYTEVTFDSSKEEIEYKAALWMEMILILISVI